MTRLWLVRHGPTHAGVMLGWTDLPADLSDTAALAALRARLPEAPIVSSDLRRAVATADALQGGRPRLQHEADLREFDFGAWDGRTHAEIDGPEVRSFFDDPGSRKAPGGESWDDVAARVGAALDRLSDGSDLIVVAHMGVILTMWARATGQRPFDALKQNIAPLSLTRIDLRAGTMAAVSANEKPVNADLRAGATPC